MMVVPLRISWQMDHHVVATCAVVVEQVRLLMKSIDYLHEHVRSALVAKATNDSAAHYLFFANVPTFMYRDSYRRTPRVRLLPALGYACIFMTCFITVVAIMLRSGLRPFCLGADVPLLKATGLRGASLFLASYWITTVRMAPACLVLFVGTPMVLCSWNLMVTELTRFPADGIIQAWWNVSSFGAFLGNWNLIVKAWLSKYAFKPMLRRGYSVTASKLATILLSAIGHEFVLVGTLGFVIPYVAFLYVFGTGE
ncbi:hypothetical protein ONE63_011336 [Megalurothrips usitatus]|uniref:Wax synthase domain-containing protein n=1 Tax=Megalurothrips usitatus TaxID=439358 RepID=A0AAV7X2W0_9NEOP|nr:hypothetical protein ONE63_011336 [Megalurothrips usitatus]